MLKSVYSKLNFVYVQLQKMEDKNGWIKASEKWKVKMAEYKIPPFVLLQEKSMLNKNLTFFSKCFYSEIIHLL